MNKQIIKSGLIRLDPTLLLHKHHYVADILNKSLINKQIIKAVLIRLDSTRPDSTRLKPTLLDLTPLVHTHQ